MNPSPIIQLAKYLPPYKGGMEYVVQKIAEATRDLGYRSIVAGIGESNEHDGIGFCALRHKGRLSSMPFVTGFDEIYDEQGTYFLHMPNPAAEWWVWRNRHRIRRLVVVFHVSIHRAFPFNWLWEKSLQAKILAAADKIWCSSPQMKQVVQSAVGSSLTRSVVVAPFCVDDLLDNPGGGETLTRDVLAIGRLVKYKGFEVLLRSMESWPPSLSLSIIGEGPERPRLSRLARQLGLEKRVRLLGSVDETVKRQQLNQCWAFVLPSLTGQEAFGMVIAEAFSCGKPVIATRVGTGVEWLGEDGACGGLVEPMDRRSLALAICKLEQDGGYYMATSARNRRFFTDHLTFDKFKENTKKVLEFV